MEISNTQFDAISSLIYRRFGIHLTEQKKGLVSGRLQKVLRNLNMESFDEYVDYLDRSEDPDVFSELIDRISTNHTFFFREREHFDFFQRTALPEITARIEQGGSGRDLRVWCAGCSSGEESYALSMLMLEHFGTSYRNWDAGLLATDISDRVLAIAKAGVYPEDRLKELPPALKHKYFRKLGDGDWAVSENLKKEITFRRFNLMNEVFPFKKPFHVIFCRNVMIYFDEPTREVLLKKFHGCLASGGYFFIGHSETIGRNNSLFEYVRPALYRKA